MNHLNGWALGLLLVLSVLLLTGCGALQKFQQGVEKNPMTAKLFTNQLTMRIIAGSDEPLKRRDEVRELVADLRKQLDGGQVFTLAEIDQAVRERIQWNRMNDADQELADFALTKARLVLADLIGEGAVEGDERHTIGTLLTWIDNAAIRVQ